jgi:hypothetical protein
MDLNCFAPSLIRPYDLKIARKLFGGIFYNRLC